MASPIFQFDENFGTKQDVLVESFTLILQDILISKRARWDQQSKDGKDFFSYHPKKVWTRDEKVCINKKDIRQWDTSLCANWLKTFKWIPHEPALKKDELKAVDNLLKLRNHTKHRVNANHVTEETFLKNCNVMKSSLSLLYISEEIIDDIIIKAAGIATVDKSKLLEQMSRLTEISWNFETSSILGSGSFGIVLSAIDSIDQVEYAIKIIPYRKFYTDVTEFKKYVSREAQILAKLDHGNVVKYKTSKMFEFTNEKLEEILMWSKTKASIAPVAHEFFSASFRDATESQSMITGLYIQTELCGETLREWLNKNVHRDTSVRANRTKDDLRNLITECIVKGINYIHSQGVIHRDLRPDNIFFAKRQFTFPVKIGDFGLSHQTKIYENATMTKSVGNALYRAPEINKLYPLNVDKAKYSQTADLYSLGLIISEIFDPVVENELRDKLNRIYYKQDCGHIITKNYPVVNEKILKLTNDDPSARQNGRVPVEWIQDFQNLEVSKVSTSVKVMHDEIPTRDHIPPEIRRSHLLNEYESSSDSDSDLLHQTGIQAGRLPVNKTVVIRERQRGSSTSATNSTGGALMYEEILSLREILKKNSSFWTASKIAEFFSFIDGKEHGPSEYENALRTTFNSCLYRIHQSKPHLLTKPCITNALMKAGFPSLADKASKLSFM